METVAVVLAGGVGLRMGYGLPKQFLSIAGKTSLEHSVTVFEQSTCIDRIIVMAEKDSLSQARNLLNGFSKVSQIEAGGATRNETTLKSLKLVPDPESKILFHDAVRPLVTEDIITRCAEALDRYDAVDCVIDSSDSMVQVDDDGMICAISDRAYLKHSQTPQGFRKKLIAEAYERGLKDPNFTATDGCSVVIKYCPKNPVKTVKGHESNIKITYPADIYLGEKLFQLREATLDKNIGGGGEGLRGQ